MYPLIYNKKKTELTAIHETKEGTNGNYFGWARSVCLCFVGSNYSSTLRYTLHTKTFFHPLMQIKWKFLGFYNFPLYKIYVYYVIY